MNAYVDLEAHTMNPNLEHLQQLTRRHFLQRSATGLGAIALSTLLKNDLAAGLVKAVEPLAPRQPHFAAKAKHVIYLHLTGSPPHLDLWDTNRSW